MLEALRQHYPEYLIEAAALGLFMVSACSFGVLVWHPEAPGAHLVPDGIGRRALMGCAMGLTAMGLIYSPWGKRSGAHMNPAVTLTFWRLGKVKAWDAFFYVFAQFAGGLLGVLLARAGLGSRLSHSSVHYVVTRPHGWGSAVAFIAEAAIAFVMMTTILHVSNSRHERWTGVFAGILVASYITFEDPFSGMSLNPARTVASAIPAMDFTALWVYLTAPVLGMLGAAGAYRSLGEGRAVHCAKLLHPPRVPCIFCQGNAVSPTA